MKASAAIPATSYILKFDKYCHCCFQLYTTNILLQDYFVFSFYPHLYSFSFSYFLGFMEASYLLSQFVVITFPFTRTFSCGLISITSIIVIIILQHNLLQHFLLLLAILTFSITKILIHVHILSKIAHEAYYMQSYLYRHYLYIMSEYVGRTHICKLIYVYLWVI